jgi:hypothetical protein
MPKQTVSASAANAFTLEYLEAIREEDEPPQSAEAEFVGPWRIVEREQGGFALYREWEGPERGDEPFLVTPDLTIAQIFQLALQVSARQPLFQLGVDREALGFPVLSEAKAVAFTRLFHEDAIPAAHALSCIVRSPQALAALVEIAGPLTQEMVGRLLNRRLEADAAEGD